MNDLVKRYFWVVHLAVVGLCAFFTGRAVTHYVTGAVLGGASPTAGPRLSRRALPPTPTGSRAHSKEPDEIVKRNIFCSGCTAAPEEKKGEADKPGPTSNDPQRTSLQLELVSTMVCPSDDAWSMAVIRDLSTKEKDPAMYNRGMTIGTTDARVLKVVNKRVYFRNNGRLEYAEMDGAAAPPASASTASLPPPVSSIDPSLGDIPDGKVKCTGNACSVERSLVEDLLKNTTALASAARFVPSMKDGKPNGFKLYAIRPSSIFGRIGLQNGDTIRAINGMEMTTPDKALEVYTKLRNASHLSVQVERRGENTTLDYSIR